MKRCKIFLIISALFMLSCQRFSNAPSPDAKEQKMNSKVAAFTDGTEVVLLLKDQQLMPAPKSAPDTFYVSGVIENGRFMPTSKVLGIGNLATSGRYGWLELNSREFFPMESDQKANTPFVKGYSTPQGFIPSDREVFDTP